MTEKDFNLIPERMEKIQTLISGKKLESLLEFKNSSDSFEYPQNSEDIRELLPKKYIEFGESVKQLGGKLLYIKSGSTGHTFKGVYPNIEDQHKKPYAMKVVAYPKKENYGDPYNIKRPENTELLMIKVLSSFVINGQTPHIILPITTFYTSIKPFISVTKSQIIKGKKFDQFVERYDNGDYYSNVSVLISEWANGGDLLDYLRKNYKSMKTKEWRAVFFQILSVLAIIHSKYPSFRHNDMKANNILIQNVAIDKNKPKYIYKINKQIYIVPNIGFQIKLWDFDFACIPGIVNNSKVEAEWTNRINVKPEQNRYYDIHYFFNTLTKKGFFPEFWTAEEIPKKVKDFVKRVIPDKYTSGEMVTDRGRILTNEEYLTPDIILKKDKFFKIMRD